MMMNDGKTELVSRLRKETGDGKIAPGAVRAFRGMIYEAYRENGRRLPWRRTRDPYRILVSEVMLQQTPVGRVLNRYGEFIRAFPNFSSLARAPLRDILTVWRGLGYNRRALALKRIAERVVREFGGNLPDRPELLETLPGIGRATARSIAAFAFNRATPFVETNIRAVFIHFFFPGKRKVSDGEILPLVEATLDRANPRAWYSALMDYGARIKKSGENPGRRSVRYRKQPQFEGSRRQLRGRILKVLIDEPVLPRAEIARRVGVGGKCVGRILADLKSEGLVAERGRRYSIG